MRNVFTKHPHAMNETYWEHFLGAICFSSKMLLGSIVCFIHAIFPFMFKKTGSDMLFTMVNDYVARTPNVDARFTRLSECLEEKKKIYG